jgi:hypothetical protein
MSEIKTSGLLEAVNRLTHERGALAEAIHDAAVKAGIIQPQSLTGPQLLLLCDDLATTLNSLPALVEALKAARSGLYDALHAGDDDDARLSVAYAKSILDKINEALKGIPQ